MLPIGIGGYYRSAGNATIQYFAKSGFQCGAFTEVALMLQYLVLAGSAKPLEYVLGHLRL